MHVNLTSNFPVINPVKSHHIYNKSTGVTTYDIIWAPKPPLHNGLVVRDEQGQGITID